MRRLSLPWVIVAMAVVALVAVIVTRVVTPDTPASGVADAAANPSVPVTDENGFVQGDPNTVLRPVPTSPPELPAAASQQSVEGAAAAVLYWLDGMNWGFASGDTNPVAPVTGGNCFTCQDYILEISESWGSGGRIEGAILQFNGLVALQSDTPDEQVVFQTFAYRAPGRLIDGAEQETPIDASQGVLNVYALWVPAADEGDIPLWVVDRIEVAPDAPASP